MKKKDIITILLVILFLAGLSLLLYPTVSSYWNSWHLSRAIVNYDKVIGEIDLKEIQRLFAEAEKYNQEIRDIPFPFVNWEKVEGYFEMLKVEGTEVMGYVKIPKLDLELPFYHGTSDGVLSSAVGHLEGSSLPVGGESTHSVLSAHCGLPSSKLFTELDRLKEGDKFTIFVLNRQMTYEVDQILVVEPTDVEALYIEEGEDYCTLMTCTPYGINSHRLLVRGHRIENVKETEKQGGEAGSEN